MTHGLPVDGEAVVDVGAGAGFVAVLVGGADVVVRAGGLVDVVRLAVVLVGILDVVGFTLVGLGFPATAVALAAPGLDAFANVATEKAATKENVAAAAAAAIDRGR